MNYKQIYKDFIADRLKREPREFRGVSYASRRYVETNERLHHHHILPSSLGGSNEADNIVSLTPREHLHAHLLLAKIHGGSQWAPVKLMCSLESCCSLTRIPGKKQRALFELAVNKYADSMMGEGNPFFGKTHDDATLEKLRDPTIYRIAHRDGRKLEGTQHDLVGLAGIPQKGVNSIVRGEKNSYRGWYNADRFDAFPEAREMYRKSWRARQKEITLYHRDGRVWRGCPVDAPVNYSLIKVSGYRHVDGWFVSREVMLDYDRIRREECKKNSQARGDISGANNPRADSRLWHWVHEETGEDFIGTKFEAYDSGRMTKTGVSSVFQKRQKRTGGWLFIGEAETTAKEG